MSDRWFFGRANSRFGPFSAEQMRQFAAAGELQPTDTVWKEGIEAGLVASRVKNLFPVVSPAAPAPVVPTAQAPPLPAPAEMEDSQVEEPVVEVQPQAEPDAGSLLSPSAEAVLPANTPAERQNPPAEHTPPTPAGAPPRRQTKQEKATVQSISGGILLSQDGKYAQFRKKCRKCGFEDRARTSQLIRNGTVRQVFFCPKCRKPSDVEIRGRVE